MNFFKKIFRPKKRERSRTSRKRNSYHDAINDLSGDHTSRDDSFLLPPPQFPDPKISRPKSAPPVAMHSRFLRRIKLSAASRFSDDVLSRIFTFVCPHAIDESYRSAEETTTKAGCMLCDMRDLASCGEVNRSWHRVAEKLQYTSIRLDAVHYCQLEDELEARRKRGSFFQKKEEPPMEVPEKRMRLLYRTLQGNERMACLVQILKMPYMTRETCKADLARLVSLTPGLRYCDLPEGVYSDDATCAGLKAILYARCPNLRKMTWTNGREKDFVDQWMNPPWQNLEVINLFNLRVENSDLVRVLNSLPSLHDLTLRSLPWISDDIFDPTANFAGLFPTLTTLSIEDLFTISIEGLKMYLSRPIVSASLTSLSLRNTQILPQQLPELLTVCISLKAFSFRATVTRALPASPNLSSKTLRTLRYEITSDASSRSLANPAPSYYFHLASSLLSCSLPLLSSLYVCEPDFAKRLVGSLTTFSRPLTIHTKSLYNLDWTKFLITPPTKKHGQLEVKALWEMPRSGLLTADYSDPRMSDFLKWDESHGVLMPPSPGFRREEARNRISSRGGHSVSETGLGCRMVTKRHQRNKSWTSLGGLIVPSRRGSRQETLR